MVATGKRRDLSRYRTRAALVAAVALFVADFFAYAQNLRRNMVGYDGPIAFWRNPEWSPLLPAWLLMAAYVLALASLLLWVFGRPALARGNVQARETPPKTVQTLEERPVG